MPYTFNGVSNQVGPRGAGIQVWDKFPVYFMEAGVVPFRIKYMF